MTVWHVYHDPPMSGARNMAIDHALARSITDGTAALRLYEWSEPTVSLGRNEPARGRGGAVVRRPTGGRAVLHRSELTYAVAVPARALGGPRALYRAVSEALVEGLRLLGAEVTLAPDGKTLRPDAGPCFDVPAEGEVVAGGGKLVGSAQARMGGALLQHGSILIEDDQSTLGSASTARPLRALVEDVTIEDVRDAVVRGFQRRLDGTSWRPSAYDEALLAMADRLEAERYGNDEWTWRR
ncbi:MAG: biotin/lipoate A/B protein ligase family protein [Gemmatimonadota bacterium]|nr:biotin/lipoate A/B protein ligase family protein [Gemmatimonadota bacterium]